MKQQKVKVAIGMSGGVDSSVSALLLKQAGYEVVGLFMKLWHDPCGTAQNACCDDRALADAHLVADKIGIPLYEVDVRKEFKEAVTDYFIDEYAAIRTPNPCVVCNKKIKFGWLLDFAKKIGCDYLATGHYARIERVASTEALVPSTRNSELGTCHLLKGIDDTKDQSYFLYQLNQEQLSHIIFPVGDMTKSEVRKIAKENDLPVFEKAESQEVCFISDNDYRSFIKRNFQVHSTQYTVHSSPFKSGDIVDKKGDVIGRHDGLVNYTVGQRKGISVHSTQYTVHSDTKPSYVIGFDKEKNGLIVGEEKELYKTEFKVENFHFINLNFESEMVSNVRSSGQITPNQDQHPVFKNLSVKIRYKAEAIPCVAVIPVNDSPPLRGGVRRGENTEISDLNLTPPPTPPRRGGGYFADDKEKNKFLIHLASPARAITPGQSAVFYSGNEVIGGGIIV